jgi:hypothetical protein
VPKDVVVDVDAFLVFQTHRTLVLDLGNEIIDELTMKSKSIVGEVDEDLLQVHARRKKDTGHELVRVVLPRGIVGNERLGHDLPQGKILGTDPEIKLKEPGYEIDVDPGVLDKKQERIIHLALHLVFLDIDEQDGIVEFLKLYPIFFGVEQTIDAHFLCARNLKTE